MILDKLMEKKDLRAYCHYRAKTLRKDIVRKMETLPVKQREKVKQQLVGRLHEIQHLAKIANNIKEASLTEAKIK